MTQNHGEIRTTEVDRPHWSYSQLAQYLRCPLQFMFQRVLGLPERFVSSNLVLGSAVHAALAHYHRGLSDGQTLPGEEVKATFHQAWQERGRREQIHFQGGRTEKDTLEQGIGLVETYLAEPPPQRILGVERAMLVPVCNSQGEVLEKPLYAVADLITVEDTGVRVHDFKTSSRAYSDLDAQTSLQAGCYSVASRETFQQPVTFQFTILLKTRQPRVQRVETTRSEEDQGRLGDLIGAVDRAVQASIFYPIESPLNCSSCPYRRPCREWGSPLGQRDRLGETERLVRTSHADGALPEGRVPLPLSQGGEAPMPTHRAADE
jgi:CRISPR/Cas system-associated exonuclease Cas4 (RecB family)